MTYDFHGSWESFADVHSPLNPRAGDGNSQLNTRDGALAWNQGGFPRYKIIIMESRFTATSTNSFMAVKMDLEDPSSSQLHQHSDTARFSQKKFGHFDVGMIYLR